jgi:hypothetical protein
MAAAAKTAWNKRVAAAVATWRHERSGGTGRHKCNVAWRELAALLFIGLSKVWIVKNAL